MKSPEPDDSRPRLTTPPDDGGVTGEWLRELSEEAPVPRPGEWTAVEAALRSPPREGGRFRWGPWFGGVGAAVALVVAIALSVAPSGDSSSQATGDPDRGRIAYVESDATGASLVVFVDEPSGLSVIWVDAG